MKKGLRSSSPFRWLALGALSGVLVLQGCTTTGLNPATPVDREQKLVQLQSQLNALQQEIETLRQTPATAINQDTLATVSPAQVVANPLSANDSSRSDQMAQVISNSGYLNDADKQAYIAAYDIYRSGGASAAIEPMRRFIGDYPNSIYIPNAYYWLGEFYLGASTPDFVQARDAFQMVVARYPRSAKAAPATYRLASLLALEGKTTRATELMEQIQTSYPSSAESGYAADWLKQHRGTRKTTTTTKKTETKPTTSTSKSSSSKSASSSAAKSTSNAKVEESKKAAATSKTADKDSKSTKVVSKPKEPSKDSKTSSSESKTRQAQTESKSAKTSTSKKVETADTKAGKTNSAKDNRKSTTTQRETTTSRAISERAN